MSIKRKILIVEDEPILRQGLEVLGDWEKNGLLLLESAINGKDALERIQNITPDIVITDIMMPVMNGIEFIERAKKEYPEMEIIVLSNYSDFIYVKEAMKAGAADYLLKAQIDFQSLLTVVNRTVEKLGKKEREEEPEESEFGLEKQAFLRRLFNGSQEEQELLLKYGMDWRNDNLFAAVIELMQKTDDPEKLERACVQVQDFLERMDVEYLPEGKGIFCLAAKWRKNRGEAIAEGLKKIMDTEDGVTFRMAVGKAGIGLLSLAESRTTAKEGLPYCFYLGENSCFDMNVLTIKREVWELEAEKLQRYLLIHDEKRILSLAQELLKKAVTDGYMDPYELLTGAEGMLHILFFSRGRQNAQKLNRMQYFRNLEKCRTYSEFSLLFTNILLECLDRSDEELLQKRNPLFCEIFDYINTHIEDELTLKSLSDRFHINYSYLSQIFKNETGENFVSYLNRRRIGMALELLKKGGYTVAEIGEKVGYHEISYFCRVFRKYTGKTPSDFMKP